MTDVVEFRDITSESVSQNPSGVIAISVVSAVFGVLYLWAWRRDSTLAQQWMKRKETVCMANRIYGPRLVPEDNAQYGIITDASRSRLQKVWELLKLRLKHKHRWISVFTRNDHTRFQSRERVTVLYTYLLSVLTFGAILHGQKAQVAGSVPIGIYSAWLAILPTICVAQVFKNSITEERPQGSRRALDTRDQDEESMNNWNNALTEQQPTRCGIFWATLCGGHLTSEDEPEYEDPRADGTDARAFGSTWNLIMYFVAFMWILECFVLIIAFTVQFDLIPIGVPEASAWAVSIVFAIFWDFCVMQPFFLLVLSYVTVSTTLMYKSSPNVSRAEYEPSKSAAAAAAGAGARKQSMRRERRGSRSRKGTAKRRGRKELTIEIGSTRGRKDKRNPSHEEIKTQPVTLGRTQGGAMREDNSTPTSRNFLIDGDHDTKRLRESSTYGQAESAAATPTFSVVPVVPATPSRDSEAIPEGRGESDSDTEASTPSTSGASTPTRSESPTLIAPTPRAKDPEDALPPLPTPTKPNFNPTMRRSQTEGDEDEGSDSDAFDEEAVPAPGPGMSPTAAGLDPAPTGRSVIAPLPSELADDDDEAAETVELNATPTHARSKSQQAELRSPSFIAALSFHKKKRNSIQPPSPMQLRNLGSPSGKYN